MHRVSLWRAASHFPGWAIGIAALLALIVTPLNQAQAQEDETDDVVIRLQSGVNIKKLTDDYDTVPDQHIAGTKIYRLPVPAGSNKANFLARLQSDPRIVVAEANKPVQNTEVAGAQLHFAFDGGGQPGAYINQQAYQQIHIGSALSVTTGGGVKVAILDTGVQAQHPALHSHLMPGYNAINPGNAPDDVPDGNTNFAVGHGTMIAGLVARLAPNAKIIPVRVLNGDGTGTLFSVIAGIHYAVQHGARVINMSFGTTQYSQTLRDAVKEAKLAGVVLVASAGNSDANTPRYPAAMNNVLAVASVEGNDVKSDYSNYGDYVGLVAPGTGIRSTYWNGGYANWSGTSFAAAFVTATAALVASCHPDYTPSQVIHQLQEASRSINKYNPGYREQLGEGLLDVERAVKGDGGDD